MLFFVWVNTEAYAMRNLYLFLHFFKKAQFEMLHLVLFELYFFVQSLHHKIVEISSIEAVYTMQSKNNNAL